jgi:hypothetical protein
MYQVIFGVKVDVTGSGLGLDGGRVAGVIQVTDTRFEGNDGNYRHDGGSSMDVFGRVRKGMVVREWKKI